MRPCTYMTTPRSRSIINGDNHHQQPKSILIFACVEQCYIFNVLVILIKIMSLPLSSLLMRVGELRAHPPPFFYFLSSCACLISPSRHMTSLKAIGQILCLAEHSCLNFTSCRKKRRLEYGISTFIKYVCGNNALRNREAVAVESHDAAFDLAFLKC